MKTMREYELIMRELLNEPLTLFKLLNRLKQDNLTEIFTAIIVIFTDKVNRQVLKDCIDKVYKTNDDLSKWLNNIEKEIMENERNN